MTVKVAEWSDKGRKERSYPVLPEAGTTLGTLTYLVQHTKECILSTKVVTWRKVRFFSGYFAVSVNTSPSQY